MARIQDVDSGDTYVEVTFGEPHFFTRTSVGEVQWVVETKDPSWPEWGFTQFYDGSADEVKMRRSYANEAKAGNPARLLRCQTTMVHHYEVIEEFTPKESHDEN